MPEVVSVFDRVLKNDIQAKLLLVGDGPDRQRAEQRCRELGICNHVRFLGKQEQVEEVLSIADLFLIPSGAETFGLAALEAMGCGVPVVSSNIGGLPEVNIHGKTGFLCDLDDIDCMAECSVKILTEKKLHKELAQNARNHAKLYELDKIVNIYEEYYEEIRAELLETRGIRE